MKPLENGVWLALLLASFFGNGATAMAGEVWGKTDGGLQMSLSASSANDMTLSLRNASKQDKMLSIGMMLAPSVATVVKGKTKDLATEHYQFPDAITLVVKDGAGKATELVIKGPPGVGGTVEPMEVPLPPGAVYSFQTPLSEYVDRKTFGPLPKGAVEITAKYESKDSHNRTNRCYWTGSLKSNTVSIKL
jgi:hypothetical protein